MVELTVPLDESTEDLHELKKVKYQNLADT